MNWLKECTYFVPALVLAAAVAWPSPVPAADAPQLDGEPLVTITEIFVNSVEIVDGELVAFATVTGEVAGHEFSDDAEIPLAITTEAPVSVNNTGCAECPILLLEVGPIHLDLLGLVIDLDDCEGGPVVLDITAVSEDGALLGNLLCALAGLLDQGLSLDEILDELALELSELNDLLADISEILNTLFENILGTDGLVSAERHDFVASPNLISTEHHDLCQGPSQVCEILFLEIGALELDLLGLVITTSDICLEITAERGSGNLLGNLLCSLTGLLDGPANQNAIDALVRNIGRVVSSNF